MRIHHDPRLSRPERVCRPGNSKRPNRPLPGGKARPGNFDAQFGHGEVLQMLGELVQAVRACQRALAVKPDSVQVLMNMTAACGWRCLPSPRLRNAGARRRMGGRADVGTYRGKACSGTR